MVNYHLFFHLNVADVLVAEFRELIKPAILQIITLLSQSELYFLRAGANALAKLSEQGKESIFLT